MKKLFTLLTLLVLTGVQAFAQTETGGYIEEMFYNEQILIRSQTGKYLSSQAHPNGATLLSAEIEETYCYWQLEKAGEPTDGVIPVYIKNVTSGLYMDSPNSNEYFDDRYYYGELKTKKVWYLSHNTNGWSISLDSDWLCDYDEYVNLTNFTPAYWSLIAQKEGIYYSLEQKERKEEWALKVVGCGDNSINGSLELPKGVIGIEAYAFQYTELESITIPEGATTVEDGAFKGCSSLESVILPSTLKTIGTEAFYECTSLKNTTIPEGVTTIGSYAFYGCSTLLTAKLPSTINTIERELFSGCSSLNSIIIPEGVTTINVGAFDGCSSLVSAALPSTLKTILDWAFGKCSALSSISIPEGVTDIGEGAFSMCGNLTEISVDMNNPSYQCINNLLLNKEKTHLLRGPNLPTIEIPAGVITIDSYAFSKCSSLQNITIPKGVTTIGGYAFTDCSSLRSITIPEGVTTIEMYAFDGCSSLNSIIIPEGVTTINGGAFARCTSLKDITFPSTLKVLNGSAFIYTPPLIMTFKSEVPLINGTSETVLERSIDLIFVPARYFEAYQSTFSGLSEEKIFINEEVQKEWDLTVEANESASGLLAALNGHISNKNLLGILNLKIAGTINSYDFMLMRNKMLNLRTVDLSEAQIVYNAYEHYQGYHTENNVFPAHVFNNNSRLTSLKLPFGITHIAPEAFAGSKKLREITIPENVIEIGKKAFYNCTLLESVSLSEGIQTIGAYAFTGTSIGSIELPEKLEAIHEYAFNNCYIKEIKFPTTLKMIGNYAFQKCPLVEIKLPTNLKSIGQYAFSECTLLQEVRIPSSIEYIESGAFAGCLELKKVYTYTIEPIVIDQTTFSTEAFQGKLYVPKTAYWNYFYYTQWSQFRNIEQFNEPYEYFYLNKDFTMNPETPRLEGETNEETNEVEAPDADFNAGSGFIVNGDEVQELGEVHLKNDGNGNGGSVIGNGNNGGGNIHAKNVHIDIEVQGGRWYFFCFPYQIDKTNIKYKGNYVLRYYDGEVRAQNGSGGWTNVAGDYLERGVGYIFQGDKDGTLTLKIADVEFNSEDLTTTLVATGSANTRSAVNAQDAGWNFIGNPHTAYFDIQDMGYDYPITVWNGSTYEALNPADDEHVLHPYQAFFVQKPDGTEEITFRAEHRQTKIQKDSQANSEARAERRLAKRMANVHRHLVNLTLGCNDSTVADRTRVVFNEESRAGYETERDAAKFMATGVAQLYSLGTGRVKYAINERPTDNGRVALGYVAPAAGSYTIALTRADVGVVLKDKLTGASHDFEKGNYTFASEAGTFDDRFLLVKSGEATGVGGVFAAGEAVVDVADGRLTVRGADKVTTTVTTLNGAVVGTLQGNGSLTVQPGVYVVKVGSHSQKVMVK